MVERTEDAGFLLEAFEAVTIGREGFGENFDGDGALEAGVACAVDFAHSASAERGLNFVGAEFGAGVEGHAGRIVLHVEGEVKRGAVRRGVPSQIATERGVELDYGDFRDRLSGLEGHVGELMG